MAALVLACSLLGSLATAGETALFASGERHQDAAIQSGRVDDAGVEGVLVVEGREKAFSDLVRWGEPATPAARAAIVLDDGSRLMCDRPWSPAGLARVDEKLVSLRRGKGWVAFPQDRVRWVLLAPEAAGLDIERLPELDAAVGEDVVLLVGGDRLTGSVEELTNESLRLRVAGETVETPVESIAALRLSGEPAKPTIPACLFGLRDGSLLRADQLSIADETYTAGVSGAEITGEAATLAFVQPLSSGVRYLSDLEPVDYRHTPYLDLAWPYERDRGFDGGLLAGGGRRAAKGVALHTAARLVYRLDATPQRFQAEIAVADPAPGAPKVGSVLFRVYLVKEGKFDLAYESGVVRAGDPATPLDVDVAGAAALALVVDFAEDGDAGDDALWLDARLVGAQ